MSIFADDSLTQGQRLVWFAVREMATGGAAPDNCSQIAGHMDSARSHVSRALQALDEAGWITREHGLITPNDEPQDRASSTRNRDSDTRDRDSQSRDSQSHKGFSFSPVPFSPKKDNHSTPLTLTPSSFSKVVKSARADPPPCWRRLVEKNAWTAEPLPDDHPARWDFQPDDWQWKAGLYCLSQMSRWNCLNSHYRKQLISGTHPGAIAAEWATTFDRLHRIDAWKQEEIAITMKWLWETDNFWRRKRVVQSVKALRRKDEDGTMKFDKIVQSAISDYEQQQDSGIDPDAIRRGFEPNGGDASESAGDAVPVEPEVEATGWHW